MTPTTHSPNRPNSRRRALARLILSAALPLVLLVAAVAFAIAGGGSDTASTSVTLRATGPVTITNSDAGKAIFTASNKRPGQSTSGDVTITNNGGDAAYTLSQSTPTGALSPALTLTITDITDPKSAKTVYPTGPFGGFAGKPISLGNFADGASRTYHFVATFTNGGKPSSDTTGDNVYQGKSASVDFTWTATAPDTTGGGGTTTTTTGDGGVTTVTPDQSAGTGTDNGGTFVTSGGGGGLPNIGLGGATTQKTTDYVTFYATCSQACSLTVGGAVSVPGGARVYRLTKATTRLRAGVNTKVTVRFPTKVRNAVRKAVRRHKTVSVALSLSTKGSAGAAQNSTRRIRIHK